MLVHTCDCIPARVMKSFENAAVYPRSAGFKFLQMTHPKTSERISSFGEVKGDVCHSGLSVNDEGSDNPQVRSCVWRAREYMM